MDTEWMRAKLEDYLKVAENYDKVFRASDYSWNSETESLNARASERLPTVEQILIALNAIAPGDELLPPSFRGSDDTIRLIQRALGILRDREEWATRLKPDEPVAPSLSAGALHSWVWSAAAPFWDAGQCSTAVESGAKSLTAHIQQKSGSKLADRELAAEVFSPRSSKGNPRLWLPGDRETDTWRSRQDGLHLMAMGVYAGIRNEVAHTVQTGWSEHDALERLAALSLVARWTVETEVVSPE